MEASDSIKEFLRENRELIDNEDFDQLFSNGFYDSRLKFGELARIFTNAGIRIDYILSNQTAIHTTEFFDHPTLTSIVIPDNIKAIYNSAFAACDKLTSVKLGNNVEIIGSNVFSNCSQLKNIELNEGLKAIGAYAFEATDIEEIVLPSSLVTEHIETGLFRDCNNLKSIKVRNNRDLAE